MADYSYIFLAILAAGSSQRFGAADKLAAPLQGKALGLHVSDRFAKMGWGWQAVIGASAGNHCHQAWQASGYAVHENLDAHLGMGHSVALAAQRAQRVNAGALIVVLADMPFVTAGHMQALVDTGRADGEAALAASHNGDHAMPPAYFGAAYFDQLAVLKGDSGARTLLQSAKMLQAGSTQLADIDTLAELTQYNRS